MEPSCSPARQILNLQQIASQSLLFCCMANFGGFAPVPNWQTHFQAPPLRNSDTAVVPLKQNELLKHAQVLIARHDVTPVMWLLLPTIGRVHQNGLWKVHTGNSSS